MTYYEEWGLDPTATEQEIRQAYRKLARLLHPDRQEDPEMLHLTTCQMTRLNHILQTLTDPEQRRRYDRALVRRVEPASAAGLPRVVPVFRTRRRLPGRIAFWGGLVLIAGGVLLWSRLDDPPGQELLAGRQPARLPQEIRPGFAGRWRYVPEAPENVQKGSYGAETIDLALQERAGQVEGQYRGRYIVGDLGISPTVEFRLAGSRQGSWVHFHWKAREARGGGELRLDSKDTLYVQWWTTQEGELDLVSGTATLVRRDDRIAP